MSDNPNPEKKSPETEIDYDVLSDTNSVASATECTGLMYLPPEDEYEAESYNSIYAVPAEANIDVKKLKE